MHSRPRSTRWPSPPTGSSSRSTPSSPSMTTPFPPPRDRGASRSRRRGSEGDRRLRARAELHRARRERRLHRQRRRPCDGDDGRDRAPRRPPGELPRRRGRRDAREGLERLPDRAHRSECEDDPRQHLRGINRCDWIAEGIVAASRELDIDVPIVARLAGTNVEEGRRILAESGLALTAAENLDEAAAAAVSSLEVAA